MYEFQIDSQIPSTNEMLIQRLNGLSAAGWEIVQIDPIHQIKPGVSEFAPPDERIDFGFSIIIKRKRKLP